MTKKKKQHSGHYCIVCHQYKANEKFSGKGHAKHICKACQNIPIAKQKEMTDELTRSFEPIYREEEWEEPIEMQIPFMPEQVSLSECGEDVQQEIYKLIMEEINGFIIKHDYQPDIRYKRKLLESIHKIETDEYGVPIKNDLELSTCYDKALSDILQELEREGIMLRSYKDTLTIIETRRLIIRKLTRDDLPALHSIMEKPEVMYAWEHGFSKKQSRQWLNRQITRYHKDGYGYFAVVLKDSGKLIGQAGLLKSVIQEQEIVELGYIFDNCFWGQGYGMEAAKACVEYARHTLNLKELYCSIRPCNNSSIRIASKLRMSLVGEHIVSYNNTVMPHVIFRLSI